MKMAFVSKKKRIFAFKKTEHRYNYKRALHTAHKSHDLVIM